MIRTFGIRLKPRLINVYAQTVQNYTKCVPVTCRFKRLQAVG